jgi:hypothetical protein
MCRRISTATAALVTTLMMTIGAVQAFERAKYPDWTGGWRRWAPPNAVREAGNGGLNLTAGGSALVRPDQAMGARTGGPAHTRI